MCESDGYNANEHQFVVAALLLNRVVMRGSGQIHKVWHLRLDQSSELTALATSERHMKGGEGGSSGSHDSHDAALVVKLHISQHVRFERWWWLAMVILAQR